MKRRAVTWTVPVRSGFQEWGRSWNEPENWRDRLRLWWSRRRAPELTLVNRYGDRFPIPGSYSVHEVGGPWLRDES